ncbi:MAG: DUF4271 domain-containing protein [Bacteroidota bacterium]|nr:DUF4271 domain-containing protein [Bacteroidota bacterium]
MRIKRISFFTLGFLIALCNNYTYAQIKKDSIRLKKADTSKGIKKKQIDFVKKMTAHGTFKITSLKVGTGYDAIRKNAINGKIKQSPDSNSKISNIVFDSEKNNDNPDTALPSSAAADYHRITHDLLLKNRLINIKDTPVFFIEEERVAKGKEFLFYTICIIILILGIFKTFYSGYFNNLFRVFFNTSLRQTQLADQLLQAKLPSFILNIFFAVSTGIYIWLLFAHFHPPRLISSKLLLPFCILSIAILYFIKYCFLKFTGWISASQKTTDNYIFIIFLTNKITGILLVPFIILIAFSMSQWINTIITITLLLIGLLFLSRYVKSYGIIEKKIPLNPLHFILYILGIEIIPLLILYKVAIDYLI